MDAGRSSSVRLRLSLTSNRFAEGSCLIRCGNTHVFCTASVEERTPPHVPEGPAGRRRSTPCFPGPTGKRSRRDISKLKLSPRSAEIQRLIGRSLRAAVDLEALGERSITVDCDVLQGDGGTRTASRPAASWPWPWPAGSWWTKACWTGTPSGARWRRSRPHCGGSGPAGPVLCRRTPLPRWT